MTSEFFFQSSYIGRERERNDLDQIWYNVIKKLWHCWLLEMSGFMNFIIPFRTGSGNLMAFLTPRWKMHGSARLYLFIITWLRRVFPLESEIPGCLTTIAERLCGPECSTREEGCQPAVSEGSKTPSAGAQYALISSSRPVWWWYVKRKAKNSVSFSKSKLTTLRLHLEADLDFNFSQMQRLSCTMRAVYCSCLFCIVLSEVTAVLLEDLSSLTGTDSHRSIKVETIFFFFLIDICQCCSNPTGRCHSTAVLFSASSLQTTVASWVPTGGSQFSVVFIFLFFSFPLLCACVCAAGEPTLTLITKFIENLFFGPLGPLTSPELKIYTIIYYYYCYCFCIVIVLMTEHVWCSRKRKGFLIGLENYAIVITFKWNTSVCVDSGLVVCSDCYFIATI